MSREFSELKLHLVMHDFNDTDEQCRDNVIAIVAIRAENAEGFTADVERLAVEKYGGATFVDLPNEDYGDEPIAAARQLRNAKRNATLLAETEEAPVADMPKKQKGRPKPSIEDKAFEQVEGEYPQAQKLWEELQANPNGYSLDEFHERLMNFVDTELCVDMVMRRNFESLDPQAQSEMLNQLAKDENISASWWFDVLFGNWPYY